MLNMRIFLDDMDQYRCRLFAVRGLFRHSQYRTILKTRFKSNSFSKGGMHAPVNG
jgi:hypothetical protein